MHTEPKQLDTGPKQSTPIRRLGDYIERWLFRSSLCQTIVLLIVAFTAAFSIAEIAARESVLSMIAVQISTLKSEFVEQNRNSTPEIRVASSIQAKAQPSLAAPYFRAEAENDQRRSLLRDIRTLELLKRNLQTLIALGSDSPDFSLRSIQKEFNQYFAASKSVSAQANSLSTFMLQSSASLLLLSTDLLLAIAIMACGTMGAMISALRGDGEMTLKSLSLGLASGFVVYLAIKGGKHVFLLQSQGDIVAFNPYGSAFAGLLTGLFTERAHQVLSTIVDDFVDRLRAASAGKKL